MNSLIFRIRKYLSYIVKAKYKRGFGVHSPFAFDTITKVYEESSPYYIYETIEKEREKLKKDDREIDVEDFGTRRSGKRRVKDIARVSLKGKSDAQLIFRAVLAMNPKTTIELGTSLGITTAYLAKATEKGCVHSFEGSREIANIAEQTAKNCGTDKNTIITVGNIDDTLSEYLGKTEGIDVAFIDANHTEEATKRYFKQIEAKLSKENGLIIIDDIHGNAGMDRAWNYIKSETQGDVTFDIYSMGLIYYKKGLSRMDYVYSRI